MTDPRFPIGVKVRSGLYFAEGIDEPVEHIPSDPAWVPMVQLDGSAKRKLSPPLVTITLPTDVAPLALTLADAQLDAANPIARFVAWIIERQAMWTRKKTGQAAPLSADPVLAVYRFCNVYREHDAVTRWITTNITEPHRDDPDCWFALAVARFVNDTAVLTKILPFLLPFDPDQMRIALEAHGTKWRRAYRAGIAGAGETRIPHLVENIFKPMWLQRETLRWRPRDTLASFAHRLRRPIGMGPFLAAQIVADYKHIELLRSASDWWTFALPGPGSRQGLNRVRGLPAETSWLEPVWCRDLAKLYVEVAPLFIAAELPRLDLQNLQNCCCEFDKFERARSGQVRGLRRYLPAPPKTKPRKRTAKATSVESETVENEPADETPAFILSDLDARAAAEPLSPQQPDNWAIIERGGTDLLDAGLRAAARGWMIFPCNANKKPLVKWRALASADPATITAWSKHPRIAMWARALPADVLLIDLDRKHEGQDGVAAFTQLQGCHPDQFEAPRVRTKSGGVHVYTGTAGRDFKNSNGKTKSGIALGIDSKTLGGYCVIPSGDGLYRWQTHPDTPLPAAPAWTEKTLRQQPKAPKPTAEVKPYQGHSPFGDAILENACKAIREAPDGAKRDTFNHRSLIVGHYVGGGLLKYDDACEQLMAAAREQGGWDENELKKWVARAVTDGMRQPQDGNEDIRQMQEVNRRYAENPQLHDAILEYLAQQNAEVAKSGQQQQNDETANGEEAPRKAQDQSSNSDADGSTGTKQGAFANIPLTTQEWSARALPEPDLLLGHIWSTTSRAILNATTGIGKTNFVMAACGHIGAGKNFLHWHCPRPRLVLYVDGEMSRQLLRERIADMVRRLGEPPTGAFFFSKEDVPGFAPLNTREGQAAIWLLIEEVQQRSGQKLDAICLDSIMALLLGDMKEEDAWRDTMPLVLALTERHIEQFWVHHTGHDATRGYGTKTREWQLDIVQHLDDVENKPPDIDIAFRLSFKKARTRTPVNRLDFADTTITLSNDRWESLMVAAGRGQINNDLTRKFYEALLTATATSNVTRIGSAYPTASIEEWRAQCIARGLLDPSKADSKRALFSHHKLKLIAANWIACSAELAWVLP